MYIQEEERGNGRVGESGNGQKGKREMGRDGAREGKGTREENGGKSVSLALGRRTHCLLYSDVNTHQI